MSREGLGAGPRDEGAPGTDPAGTVAPAGTAPPAGTVPPTEMVQRDASDLDAPVRPVREGSARAASPGAAARARGRWVLAAALGAALAAGGFAVGQRAAPPATAGAPGAGLADLLRPGPQDAGRRDASPAAYAQLFPDEGDRRVSTVVVSWAGVTDLGPDARVAVAVVTDDRTRVVAARLGGGPEGRAGLRLDRGDLARAVLAAAGEDAGDDVPVVPLHRSSGTVAVELLDEGYDLTVATAPRVHLAVVRGTAVRQVLAVPVAGPRPGG